MKITITPTPGHGPRYSRAQLIAAIHKEAAGRGDAWLVSILRPTGALSIEKMETSHLLAAFDTFFTFGQAKPGIVSP